MSDASAAARTGNVFAILSRYVILIAATTIIGLGLGLLIARFQPTSYTAESRVFLSSQASFDAIPDGQYASDPSRYLDQQASIMTSTPLLLRAIELGAGAVDVSDLKQSVTVIASAESDVLTVRAAASDSTQAATRVDDIITAYREYQTALVTDQLTAIQKVSNADERRLAQQRAAVYGDGVELVETASVTEASSAIRNASVLAVVGLLLGSGLAFTLDARRTAKGPRAPRRSEPTAAGGTPDWGDSVPATDRAPSADPADSPVGAASTRGSR